MTPHEAITEITRRVVEYYRPEQVYLFGSVVPGEEGPDSDLDFLVVVPDDIPTQKLRGGEIYRNLFGLGVAADIVPWRLSDFRERAAAARESLPATALREGRLLYDAGTLAA